MITIFSKTARVFDLVHKIPCVTEMYFLKSVTHAENLKGTDFANQVLFVREKFQKSTVEYCEFGCCNL